MRIEEKEKNNKEKKEEKEEKEKVVIGLAVTVMVTTLMRKEYEPKRGWT